MGKDKMKVHCLFEQSGTFKNEFKKLGFQAYDYDILNDFNETDNVIDIFNEIETAYKGGISIFDSMGKDDLIMAFFPCIRFSNQAYMMFQCTQRQLKDLSDLEKIDKAMEFHNELSFLYDMICKLCCICLRNNLKLIIENPYSQEHYLTRYFPIKPKIIDMDRTKRGDNFKKPTQYWFINCEPKNNLVMEPISLAEIKIIHTTYNKVERSLINPNYAERFIKEFVL